MSKTLIVERIIHQPTLWIMRIKVYLLQFIVYQLFLCSMRNLMVKFLHLSRKQPITYVLYPQQHKNLKIFFHVIGVIGSCALSVNALPSVLYMFSRLQTQKIIVQSLICLWSSQKTIAVYYLYILNTFHVASCIYTIICCTAHKSFWILEVYNTTSKCKIFATISSMLIGTITFLISCSG